jgi:4-hydroxy-tetrahydrodipicolinate synthase
VIAVVCEQAAGRIKVMAGTGSNSTREAIRLTKFAKASGADGALMVAPYYNKPTQEGFYQHYKGVAEAVDLPIVLYNIPGRTAKNMEPETIVRIGELPSVVAVKESTGSMDQASHILAASNLTILSGDDSLTLPLMSLGGRGVVSVVGNIIPRDVKAMIAAYDKGDLAAAKKWHYKLFPLCRDMLGLATNPIPIKGAMKMLGRDTGELRLPMTPLTTAEEQRLSATLRNYGLL